MIDQTSVTNSLFIVVNDTTTGKPLLVAIPQDTQIGTSDLPRALKITGGLAMSVNNNVIDGGNGVTINVSRDSSIVNIDVTTQPTDREVNVVLPSDPTDGQVVLIQDASSTADDTPIVLTSAVSGTLLNDTTSFTISSVDSSALATWTGSSWIVRLLTSTSSSAGSSSGGGDPGPTYLVLSATGSLSRERVFNVSGTSGLIATDAGAGSNYTLQINDNVVATVSGTRFTGPVVASAGLSGSLQQISTNLSYLVAGAGVTVTSQSNGQIVLVASTSAGTGQSAWVDGGNKIRTTSSVAIDADQKFADAFGSDVYFFVSGSADITSGANRKVSVLSGDTVVSGTTYFGSGSMKLKIAGSQGLIESVPDPFVKIVFNDYDKTLTFSEVVAGPASGSQTFTYTATTQSFTVPNNVSSITVKMWGGGGGAGDYDDEEGGGASGFTSGTVSVTAGEEIFVIVGGAGLGVSGAAGTAGNGGFGGGGRGSFGDASGGGGGGYSGIFTGSVVQQTAIMIVGGGGGSTGFKQGGGGGGTNGSRGGFANVGLGADATNAGGGGTQIAGGVAGDGSTTTPKAGSPLQGGDGVGAQASGTEDGGGGGGGYFGGGGGFSDAGGGGGGSGFLLGSRVTNGTLITGNSGSTNATRSTPPFTTDPAYQAGVGEGGAQIIGAAAGQSGGPGLVYFSWGLDEQIILAKWYEDSANNAYITSSINVGSAQSAATSAGQEAFVFVSGTIGTTGSFAKKTIFGGDVRVSGSLTVGTGSVTITSNTVEFSSSLVRVERSNISLKFFDEYNTAGVTLRELVSQADVSASYVTVGTTGSLPNERALAAGPGISLNDGGSGGSLTVSTVIRESADVSASYIVISNTGSLPNERALAAGPGISLTDGGANGSLTLSTIVRESADVSASYVVISVTGSLPNERALAAGPGISLSDAGAGGNVTVTTIVRESADVSASYVTISNTGSLPNERSLSAGPGLLLTDAGANNNVSFAINDNVVATVSGTRFTGPVSASAGLSGSLQQVSGGLSYLVAGTYVTVTSQSNGQIVISGNNAPGADPGASFVVVGVTASLANERALAAGPGISLNDGGAGGSLTVSTIVRESADVSASYIVINTTGSLPNERSLAVGSGLLLTDDGAGSTATLSINDNVIATVSGTRFTGPVSASAGLSGSLQQVSGGLSYLVAGSNVTIASQSNGQIVISSADATGADSAASFVVVGVTSSLANERALAAGPGISLSDGGAGNSLTLSTIVRESADVSASYVTISNTGSLPNERVLAAGTGLLLTDNGANSSVSFAINDNVVATVSGTTFTGPLSSSAGITGSITHIGPNGLTLLVAQGGISITTASNGQIFISGSNNAVVPLGSSYIVVTNDGVLTNERALSAGAGILFADTGAGGTVTVATSSAVAPSDPEYVTLATNTILSNERVLSAGAGILIDKTGAGGTVTVATSSAVAPSDPQYITLATNAILTNERVLSAGAGILFADTGAGGTLTVTTSSAVAPSDPEYVTLVTNAILSNERVLSAGAGILIDKTGAGGTVTVATSSAVAPSNAQYVTLATDAILSNERVLSASIGLLLTDAGAGSTISAEINDNFVATVSGTTFRGPVTASLGISAPNGTSDFNNIVVEGTSVFNDDVDLNANTGVSGSLAVSGTISSTSFKVKKADQTFVVTSLVNDNTLSVSLPVGAYRYWVEARIAGSTADDAKVQLAGSGGLALSGFVVSMMVTEDTGSSAANVEFTDSTTTFPIAFNIVLADTSARTVYLTGGFTVTTPGNFLVQWGKITDVGGDMTVNAGATLIVLKE